MKVSATKLNTSSINQKTQSNTSFKGRHELNRVLSKHIEESSDKYIKKLIKLGKNNGERLTTLVTAFGTACVAPIFIAFNPFAKEDKETKIYSAMRQPISAIIALTVQLNVNKKFNNWLDKLASTGQLDRADLTAKPQNSYIENGLKKKKLTPKELEKVIEQEQDKAFWENVNKARSNPDFKVINYDELVDTKFFNKAKEQLEEENIDKIKGLSKKAKSKIITEELVNKRATQLVETEVKNEAAIKYTLNTYAKSGKSFDDIVDGLKIKQLRLEKQLENTGSKPTSAKEALAITKRLIEKLENAGSLDNIKKHGDTFEEVLQSVKIKQLVKSQINNSEHVLKSFKKWSGLVVALATLPISCGILNWSYPRIMEKLMPNISNAKKAKEAK